MTSHRHVALTGATGFIGSAVLSRLLAGGWTVRALHRPRRDRTPASQPGVEWIEGDLGDVRSLDALVTGADAVVHCAGSVRGARAAGFERVNAEGTRRLLEAAARASQPPRFLLMSSLAARMPDLSAYAASKRHGERVLEAAMSNVRWTVFRPPAVYGPGDRELEPVFRWIARGVAPMPAGGAGRFSLIYVDDLASAVLRWLEIDGGDGRTFELDDGHPGGYDWDTVLAAAARVLRGGARVRRLPVPVALLHLAAAANVVASRFAGYDPMLTPGKVREITHPDWLCDSHDFVNATGWQAAVRLEEGLARGYGSTHP
jgi:nucleoside-diphosphate-sugar epimerase